MSDDRRKLLESIAFGRDPKLTPGDRLRALEQLHAEEELPIEAIQLAQEIREMPDVELDRELLGVTKQDEPPKASTSREVERRTAERIQKILHAEKLPPALQERVEQLAQQRIDELVTAGELSRTRPKKERKRPLLPPQLPDDPELARAMQAARERGENPFETVPGAITRQG